MKVITKDEIFDDFAWVLEITDEHLERLRDNPKLIETDLNMMLDLMKSKSHNAHILQLTLNNNIEILGQAQRLLKIYDSVSWIHEGKFYLKRK